MKKRHLLQLAICLLVLASCNRNADHQAALKYYVTVAANTNEVSSRLTNFWTSVAKNVEVAKHSPGKKLDPLQIDTLRLSFNETLVEIEDVIDTLKNLKEVDEDINLKEKILVHLEGVRDIQHSAIPEVLKILSDGLSGIDSLHVNALQNSNMQATALQGMNTELQNSGENFRLQHGISAEELNKYGL
jgi:hypothetical protein